MNNLNSVLIEGSLEENAKVRTTKEGNDVIFLTINSNRYYKKNDEPCKEVMQVQIEIWHNLPDIEKENLTEGRGVRIVGRLNQYGSQLVVIAEHTEFKPLVEE